jgi:hypothetical protein
LISEYVRYLYKINNKWWAFLASYHAVSSLPLANCYLIPSYVEHVNNARHLPAPIADELIRQVTLDGPERGLLLLRVRDEARMTADAYKILYESRCVVGLVCACVWSGSCVHVCGRIDNALEMSWRGSRYLPCVGTYSVVYGIRKQLQAEQGMDDLDQKVRGGLLAPEDLELCHVKPHWDGVLFGAW